VEQTELQLPSTPNPPAAIPIIEAVSKSVAVFVLVLYTCGYLVTSIYQSKFGFTEMSALRPRIVSAGAWFFLFMSIPFAIVNGVLKQKAKWQAEDRWWAKFASMLGLYYFACQSLSLAFYWFFDFPYDPTPAPATAAGIGKFGLKAFLFLLLIIAANFKQVPKPVSSVAMTILVGYLLWSSVRDLFVFNRFNVNSVWLWFFAVGILLVLEMRGRAWKLRLGDWPQSVSYLVVALFGFGLFYYPHIKSSLGGGAPVPISIYFTKDSALMPGSNLSAFLIDETEAGVYIAGKNDKKATFVPRSSISLIYFSDNASDNSLSRAK
jgi:hypothetical protein